MENNKTTHIFRSDEIINIVLAGIGITREDISTYKDYSYSNAAYLRLRVSDHGLFLQNWYDVNKKKRENGESVPKLKTSICSKAYLLLLLEIIGWRR